ncbi:MAG: UpxY family transcription antiterminator [Acidobacteriia bacterium]|nr:UpxY family transcription antiterminator [Terriglobia bacterium]
MISFDQDQWFAIHVRSRHERLVASLLSNKGYPCFLPTYRSTHCWSDRRKEIEIPLFPSYLFASFDPNQHVSVIKSSGVVKVVSFGQQLAPVNPVELDYVQTILNSGQLVLPWPYLAAGDQVYLEAGPLRGMNGIIVRTKGSLRLVVSVSLLQRSVAVEIDRDWVRPSKHYIRLPSCAVPAAS